MVCREYFAKFYEGKTKGALMLGKVTSKRLQEVVNVVDGGR